MELARIFDETNLHADLVGLLFSYGRCSVITNDHLNLMLVVRTLVIFRWKNDACSSKLGFLISASNEGRKHRGVTVVSVVVGFVIGLERVTGRERPERRSRVTRDGTCILILLGNERTEEMLGNTILSVVEGLVVEEECVTGRKRPERLNRVNREMNLLKFIEQ